jgi:hypothetical protein
VEEKSGKHPIYFVSNIQSYQVIVYKIIELEAILIFYSVHTHATWKETENQKKKKNNYRFSNQEMKPSSL